MTRNAISNGKYYENGVFICPPSFQEMQELFFNDMRVRKYSPATLKSHGASLRIFFYFLVDENIDSLQDVTIDDIEKYRLILRERDLSGSTIEHYLESVRMFFRFLEDGGHVFSSPARDLVIPKGKVRVENVPTENEMKKLLSAPDVSEGLGIRDRAIIEVMYSTGVRNHELVSLDFFDPDLKSCFVKIRNGKGKKDRMLPLGRHAVFWLGRYLAGPRDRLLNCRIDEKALWITVHGKRLNGVGLSYLLLRHCISAGIRKITPHEIRRACATHMLNNGAHPVQVQMLLGHADLRTLRHYLKLTVADLKKTHSKSRIGK